MSGSCMTAQARARRCLKPSGRVSAEVWTRGASLNTSTMRSTAARRAARRNPYTPEKKARFWATLKLPYRENFWAM